MMTEAESLHTAARRYCMERADVWRAKYGEIAKRNERPAKSGLLKKLGLTVPGKSDEGRDIYPRYNVLDAILIEIERRAPSEFASLDDVAAWLAGAARVAYEKETRPPDLMVSDMKDIFSPEMRERMLAAGPQAKIVVGRSTARDRSMEHRAMKDERDAFASYLSALTKEDLAAVVALPYRRTLDEGESDRLWQSMRSRWGIDGYWYPHDRQPEDEPPKDTVAFRAEPFRDRRLVQLLQDLLRLQGVARVYELREGGRSVDYEIDLELLRPWYNFDEGFWLDDSVDWIVYASHDGSVTVSGARLLPAFQQSWANWYEYGYVPSAVGVEREIGPGVRSTRVTVKPPE